MSPLMPSLASERERVGRGKSGYKIASRRSRDTLSQETPILTEKMDSRLRRDGFWTGFPLAESPLLRRWRGHRGRVAPVQSRVNGYQIRWWSPTNGTRNLRVFGSRMAPLPSLTSSGRGSGEGRSGPKKRPDSVGTPHLWQLPSLPKRRSLNYVSTRFTDRISPTRASPAQTLERPSAAISSRQCEMLWAAFNRCEIPTAPVAVVSVATRTYQFCPLMAVVAAYCRQIRSAIATPRRRRLQELLVNWMYANPDSKTSRGTR